MKKYTRLYVTSLPSKFDEQQVRKVFSKYGNVTDCRLKRNNQGKSRRIAFVGFKTNKEASRALDELNDSVVMNQKIKVEVCKDFTVERKIKMSVSSNLAENMNDASTEGFWVKMKGCPFKVTNKMVEEFYYPLKPATVDILKKDNGKANGMVLVKFLTEQDQQKALKSNKDYMEGRFIDVQVHKIVNNTKKLDVKQHYKKVKNLQDLDAVDVAETGRLFVRNLSYDCTEDDLKEHFEEIGLVTESTLITDRVTDKNIGTGYITYASSQHALLALEQLDGTSFQGRMIHVLPSLPKDEEKASKVKKFNNESSYQNQKYAKQRSNMHSAYNWSTFYIDENQVANVMQERHGVDKLELMNDSKKGFSANVKMAMASTNLTQETTKWLESHGLKKTIYENPTAERNEKSKMIIVKNLNATTTSSEIRHFLDNWKSNQNIKKLLLSPSNTTALIKFSTSFEAKKAFMKIAYRPFQNKPLIIEWAPVESAEAEKEANETDEAEVDEDKEVEENEEDVASVDRMTIYVKNLNFDTTKEDLQKHFEQIGPVEKCHISLKIRGSQQVSMGYGFVEYKHSKHGMESIKRLQYSELDNHKLELEKSDKKLTQDKTAVVRKAAENQEQENSTKILVRNIAFSVTQQEIQNLFSQYGELKSVKLPIKNNAILGRGGQHKGFGFVDFMSKTNASQAFEALKVSTRMAGRRLVLEWAKSDSLAAEAQKRKATENYEFLSKKRTYTGSELEEKITETLENLSSDEDEE